ncbi:MAG: hypothetical protein PHV30_11525, partial [Candidatus Margulisbacteria bacterium]|nr:hypothetical protein [Candidatus Margulisiibacteriota bacterium]
FISWMSSISQQLVSASINSSISGFDWLWLTPIVAERAAYSGSIVFVGVVAIIFITFVIFHVKQGTIKRCDAWDCGFEKLTPRMQYNATSFAMPIRRIFGGLFSVREKLGLKYHLRVRDYFVGIIYKPIVNICYIIARQLGRLQQGHIQQYLIYSFVTIIVLLILLK